MRSWKTTLPVLLLVCSLCHVSRCEAGLWKFLGRKLGLGWSDGYNAAPRHASPRGHWHYSARGYHDAYEVHPYVSPHVVPGPVREVPRPTPAQPQPPLRQPRTSYGPSPGPIPNRPAGTATGLGLPIIPSSFSR